MTSSKALKTAARDREFRKLCEQMRTDRETCVVKVDGCTWFADTKHHIKSKAQGGDNSPENLLNTCTNCHTAGKESIHQNINWAVRRGFIIQKKSASIMCEFCGDEPASDQSGGQDICEECYDTI